MRRIAIAALLTLFVLSARMPVNAQADDDPPYLYYYSQLLGGLIVERADGTDSRIIGQDVIPPNMTGLGGPGWSPSGKYFAAYNIVYETYTGHNSTPYVIDTNGNAINGWLGLINETVSMQWSPTGENILLIEGKYVHETISSTTFWLINAETGELMADFATFLASSSPSQSEVTWDVLHRQIVFYIEPNTYDTGGNRVTMHFDGTTLREPTDASAFILHPAPYDEAVENDRVDAHGISPSGTYNIRGRNLPILTNTRTKTELTLPQHTQETTCGSYVWNDDEQYIITLNGTATTDGCGSAVLGVTDNQGKLWRELGGCTWDTRSCVGWLPDQVEVAALPSGALKPVQLDPVRIERDDNELHFLDSPDLKTERWICIGKTDAKIVDASKQTLYKLADIPCPFEHLTDGQRVAVAHDPAHDLLATYTDFNGRGVQIWAAFNGVYKQVLRLNSEGLGLEFTPDGVYLRARNPRGWKVYAVDEILAAAQANPT